MPADRNTTSPTLLLAAGAACVAVVPAIGGSIASFRWRDREVMRSATAEAIDRADVLGMACYPLVPYSNRIAGARLQFAGALHRLARNFGPHPHSIHGLGWQRSWQVVDHDAGRVVLALRHEAKGDAARHWPWPFAVEQTLALREEGEGVALDCSLAVTNTGSETFPCGLGWHPFFPRDASTRLDFAADGAWSNDGSGLPGTCRRPEPWGFAAGRDLAGVDLDHVFEGWAGSAQLANPTNGLATTLTASAPCRHLVVYAPRDAGFAAVEPVTHVTDAFNRAARGDTDTGMLLLAPGTRISCTMRISAAPLR